MVLSDTLIIVFTVLLALVLLIVGLRRSYRDIVGYIGLAFVALLLIVYLYFGFIGVISVELGGTRLLIRDKEGEVI